MQTVGIIFVSAHNFVGQSVQIVTNSQWAHVGIIMPSLGGIVEAVFPRVTISPIDKYEGIYTEIIEMQFDDEQYLIMEQVATQLIGRAYGIDDCIIGGLQDISGNRISQFINHLIDIECTIDCSATVMTILRSSGINLLPEQIVAQITPNDLYFAIKQF